MVDIRDSFRYAPARQRRELSRLFEEYAALRTIEQAAIPHHSRLFESIYKHEEANSRANRNILASIGGAGLPENYSREWISAFLSTIALYYDETDNYPDVVRKFEAFRNQEQPALQFLLKRTGFPSRKSVPAFLSELVDLGFPAERLGAVEAHWQMRRVAQLFYGRYSAEMREDPEMEPAAYLPQNPAPDLKHFSRRQRIRADLMGKIERAPGTYPIDNEVYLALYLDRLRTCS